MLPCTVAGCHQSSLQPRTRHSAASTGLQNAPASRRMPLAIRLASAWRDDVHHGAVAASSSLPGARARPCTSLTTRPETSCSAGTHSGRVWGRQSGATSFCRKPAAHLPSVRVSRARCWQSGAATPSTRQPCLLIRAEGPARPGRGTRPPGTGPQEAVQGIRAAQAGTEHAAHGSEPAQIRDTRWRYRGA